MSGSASLRLFGRVWLRPLTLLGLALPFLYLAWQWIQVLTGIDPRAMGADFVAYTHHFLGDTAIRVLLITLAITPLRDITGWAPLALVRRRIGLAAFIYSALHLIAYLWLDQNWDLALLWEDMVLRTYIMLGMLALVMMAPLALTSTNGMIRRLGRKGWEKLHWLIYPLAVLAIAHNLLMVKVIYGAPLAHAIILAVLLAWRAWKLAGGRLSSARA